MPMMRVNVNGQTREVPDDLTVACLIELLKLHPHRLAVERNRRLVRRAEFAETPLAADDAIEIVTLVGGG